MPAPAYRILAAGTVALLALIGAGFASSRLLERAPAAERLTIALPPVPAASLLHIAAAKGYFAAEGLEVTIAPASHGQAALGMVVDGKADVAAAADVPFTIAILKGEPLAAVASISTRADELSVVARRDRRIAAPRDLAGKRLGASFGTTSEYFLWAFLVRHRIAPESVRLVNVAPSEIPRALGEGSVDAAATWPPMVHEAIELLGNNAVTFSEPIAYSGTFSIIGRRAFLEQRRGAVEKLLRALVRAERFTAARPEEALRLVAARFSASPDALRPTWDNFGFRVELAQSQLATMEDQARWAIARGYAPAQPVPNLLPHLYLEPLFAVDPARLGVVSRP